MTIENNEIYSVFDEAIKADPKMESQTTLVSIRLIFQLTPMEVGPYYF